MNPTIFVHCVTKFNRDMPFITGRANEAYAALVGLGRRVGFDVLFSRYPFFDKKTKSLRHAWTFDKKWKKIKNQKVDILYYRGQNSKIMSEAQVIEKQVNLPIINHLALEQICDDKVLTYNILPELVPKTFLINNSYELQRMQHFLKTDKVVLKPRFGSFGKDVVVIDKKDLRNGISKNTVIQEFVDTSAGIMKHPGIHDFRFMIVDGKIDHCYLRIPKKGSLISNSSVGGKKIFVDPDELPNRITRKVKLIDGHFKHYGPRIYSIDLMQGPNKKVWLLELNSKPGIFYYDGSKRVRKKFYKSAFGAMRKLL
tara:strand:+ start:44 stop:979 length:936 start_codon:yes stop_codon:yes gene_type:complete